MGGWVEPERTDVPQKTAGSESFEHPTGGCLHLLQVNTHTEIKNKHAVT